MRRNLTPTMVHILLCLTEGERHGYAIKQEVEQRTDRDVRLGPGTLYEAIQRLERSGFLRPVTGPPRPWQTGRAGPTTA